MPNRLEPTYQAAQKGGATGIRSWLKRHGAKVQDPRKAWIELDYAVPFPGKIPWKPGRSMPKSKIEFLEESESVPARVKELEKSVQIRHLLEPFLLDYQPADQFKFNIQ